MMGAHDKRPRKKHHAMYTRYQIKSSIYLDADFNSVLRYYRHEIPIRRKEREKRNKCKKEEL